MFSYETLDGYKLQEGDKCFVCVSDPARDRQSIRVYPAYYMDETAKAHGWDFTVNGLPERLDADYDRLDADYGWEITHVWKNNPRHGNYRQHLRNPDEENK